MKLHTIQRSRPALGLELDGLAFACWREKATTHLDSDQACLDAAGQVAPKKVRGSTIRSHGTWCHISGSMSLVILKAAEDYWNGNEHSRT